jgi:hypothetical protein
MLTRLKQYFCNHNSIETKTETGLNAINNGYFFVKTLIYCTQCKKSFPQHPNQMCCYVMHIQHELIRECIVTNMVNKIKESKQ